MAFPVLLDDSVLRPALLCDLVLRLAEADCFQPVWSADVTVEVHRHLSLVVGQRVAARRLRDLAEAFPDAAVTGHEALAGAMTCSPRHRPVLAAAVHAGCHAIVTTDLDRFPTRSTARYFIRVVHPDDFLLDLLDDRPSALLEALDTQMAVMREPHLTVGRFLTMLEAQGVPDFIAEMRRRSGSAAGF